MRKSGRPREFNQSQVIDSAMELFWKIGYEACSTDELCKQTGLGKGSLYNAYGSKHALYEKALLRYHEIGIQAQVHLLQQQIPVKERFRALLDYVIQEDFSENGRSGCMLINAAMERAQRDPMVERIFTQHVNQLENALRRAIEEGRQSREITRAGNTDDLVALFLSSYYGLRVLNAGAQDRTKAIKTAEATLNVLF